MTRILLSIHFLVIIMLHGYISHAQYDTLHLVQDHCPGACNEMPLVLGSIDGNVIVSVSTDSFTTLYTYKGNNLIHEENVGKKRPLVTLPATSPNVWASTSVMLNNSIYYCSTRMFSDSIKLYRWDGSGMPQLKNPSNSITYSTTDMLPYNGKLYISAYQPITYKPVTYTYDPETDEMTQVIDRVVTSGVVYKNKFYGTSFDTLLGAEMHEFDPATGKLRMMADANPGVASSEPNSMIVAEGKLFYIASDPVYNNVLYEYDGTGTPVPILRFEKDPAAIQNLNRIFTPYYHDGKLYMQCNVGSPVRVYHYTYHIATGTIGQDTVMNTYGANMPYASYNGKLFFWSYSGSTWPVIHRGIYIYDVANGNIKPMPVADSFRTTYFGRFDVMDDALYVTMETEATGMELFRYAEEKTAPINNQATLYPNPATDKAYINTKLDASNVFTLIMHDATGRLISQQRLGIFGKGTHKVEIPLQHLAAGMYICTLRGSKNILFKGKLVKL